MEMDFFGKKIIVITGPTASGKSKKAVEVAKEVGGEVINCDSVQLYKNIPILAAVPLEGEMDGVTHHLYEMLSPDQRFSVAEYIELADRKIEELESRGKIPIFVGGTGFYIKSLIFGISEIPCVSDVVRERVRKLDAPYEKLIEIDPIAAASVNPNDRQRILRQLEILDEHQRPLRSFWEQKAKRNRSPDNYYIYKLLPPREELYKKINDRFIRMIELGVIEEVKNILTKYEHPEELPIYKADGFSSIADYLCKRKTLEEAISEGQKYTRRYAKRQYTFFRHQL